MTQKDNCESHDSEPPAQGVCVGEHDQLPEHNAPEGTRLSRLIRLSDPRCAPGMDPCYDEV
jgi:hypothetical protein